MEKTHLTKEAEIEALVLSGKSVYLNLLPKEKLTLFINFQNDSLVLVNRNGYMIKYGENKEKRSLIFNDFEEFSSFLNARAKSYTFHTNVFKA